MELELYNTKQQKNTFSVKEIIGFLNSKGIKTVFEGNKEQIILGLSHVEQPENNTIIYSEYDKMDFKNNVLISTKQKGINIINVEDAKLVFYYLSDLFYRNQIVSNSLHNNHNLYENCVIGNNCFIRGS